VSDGCQDIPLSFEACSISDDSLHDDSSPSSPLRRTASDRVSDLNDPIAPSSTEQVSFIDDAPVGSRSLRDIAQMVMDVDDIVVQCRRAQRTPDGLAEPLQQVIPSDVTIIFDVPDRPLPGTYLIVLLPGSHRKIGDVYADGWGSWRNHTTGNARSRSLTLRRKKHAVSFYRRSYYHTSNMHFRRRITEVQHLRSEARIAFVEYYGVVMGIELVPHGNATHSSRPYQRISESADETVSQHVRSSTPRQTQTSLAAEPNIDALSDVTLKQIEYVLTSSFFFLFFSQLILSDDFCVRYRRNQAIRDQKMAGLSGPFVADPLTRAMMLHDVWAAGKELNGQDYEVIFYAELGSRYVRIYSNLIVFLFVSNFSFFFFFFFLFFFSKSLCHHSRSRITPNRLFDDCSAFI
jgi:hypothetical protein